MLKIYNVSEILDYLGDDNRKDLNTINSIKIIEDTIANRIYLKVEVIADPENESSVDNLIDYWAGVKTK